MLAVLFFILLSYYHDLKAKSIDSEARQLGLESQLLHLLVQVTLVKVT